MLSLLKSEVEDETAENLLVQHGWVRIMCDFAAEGVWAKDGTACLAEELPVTQALRDRILAWQHVYENRRHDAPIPDHKAWRREGWNISLAVKRELPDWTVMFFDEAEQLKGPVRRNRKPLEYEVELFDTLNPK